MGAEALVDNYNVDLFGSFPLPIHSCLVPWGSRELVHKTQVWVDLCFSGMTAGNQEDCLRASQME